MAEVFATCAISVVGSVAANGDLVAAGASTLSIVGSLSPTGTAYVTQYLAYSGTISAGEVLVIDCEKMTVKLDGVNARANHSGVFPTLYAGTNELRWADDDVSRTVGIEVEHEPRYL